MQEATVLQIEDNDDILLVGKRVFMEAGFTFLSAKTGEEGFKKALRRKPSVIILDYYLGDETGTDFIYQIATESKYETLRNIPFVILSGNADLEKEMYEFYGKGLRAVLKKPFGYRELVNVVENIITLEYLQAKPADGKGKNDIEKAKTEDPPEWLNEVRMTAETIAGLARDIYRAPMASSMSEKIKMDLYAVYNSSRRLLQLLKSSDAA